MAKPECVEIHLAVEVPVADPNAIGFFEKYLTLWVFLCIVAGSLIGYYNNDAAAQLAKAEFAEINAIVAVLLWIMIFPMLVQIDYSSLKKVKDDPGAIALTSIINYAIKPFSMYALAILFFRVFYTSVIQDSELRDNYIAGLILLAGAPCTAMVFCWSCLTGGDPAYTLVQVAFNDLLLLAFYIPTCVLLIGVSNISLPWLTIIYAVILFIAAPLVLSAAIRSFVVSRYGVDFLTEKIVKPFKPVTIIALLATLVLIFIFQGKKIGDKPLQIVLIAIPITIQCVLNWAFCYYVGFTSCIPHSRLAPASMIATSNFFELAVAVAISVYGLESGAALATVVGVLVEVPVMLALTAACNRLKPMLDERCARCEELCDWSNKANQKLTSCCGGGSGGSISALPTCRPMSSLPQQHEKEGVENQQQFVIYHNPECETSRNVLRILREEGHEPVVVDYLKTGWTRLQLLQLFEAAGLTPRTALRDTKSPAKELGLLDPSVPDEKLLDFMLEHPVLCNRPIVVTPAGTRLCRPSETVRALLTLCRKEPVAVTEQATV